MAVGPISREQADTIVRAHLAAGGHRLTGRTVANVISLGKLRWRPPCVYDLRIPLAKCWIAYLAPLQPNVIGPSDIVLVSRDSGEIVYAGRANDEG